MRALETVDREVNLRVIDVHVGVVGESEADAVVESENQLAVGDALLEALRRGQLLREQLPTAESRALQRPTRLRRQRTSARQNEK